MMMAGVDTRQSTDQRPFADLAQLLGVGGSVMAQSTPSHGREVVRRTLSERTVRLEWAVAGLVIWLISLGTCFVCETATEPIDLGYAHHENARGTTERPQ